MIIHQTHLLSSFYFLCRLRYLLSTISLSISFFFNDTATTEIYTLSLHDALPILPERLDDPERAQHFVHHAERGALQPSQDRKSTRLNSSHGSISYAVFCLKKKKKIL